MTIANRSEWFGYAYVAGGVALVVAAVVLWRRRLRHRKAMSYVRRDEAGNIYAIDPQTGTWHRLDIDYATRTVAVASCDMRSPRQRRREKRAVRS